jgi:hypothetical protein
VAALIVPDKSAAGDVEAGRIGVCTPDCPIIDNAGAVDIDNDPPWVPGKTVELPDNADAAADSKANAEDDITGSTAEDGRADDDVELETQVKQSRSNESRPDWGSGVNPVEAWLVLQSWQTPCPSRKD